MKETNENASVPQRPGKLLSGAASSLYDRVTMNAEDYEQNTMSSQEVSLRTTWQ
jgi:hypothetical protein